MTTDARTVVARAISDNIDNAHRAIDWLPTADAVLAALAAAGKTIVDDPGWEWGVRWATGTTEKRASREEAEGLRRDYPNYVRTALRRRPADPWEVAPDA